MNVRKILLILLIKGCTCVQPLLLYAQPFNYTVYREADGLPSGYVQKAFEDSRGYLWLCTIGGISRFDGRNFKNYDIKNGLPDNFCDEICEDKKGNLWIATRSGLCYFDGKNFKPFTSPAGLTTIYFRNLSVDTNNRLLCVLNHQNAMAANGKVEFVNLLKNIPGLPAEKYVAGVLSDGSKIIDTKNGIYTLTKNGLTKLIFSYKSFTSYFCFDAGEKDVFYFFNEQGAYRWQQGKLQNLTHINFNNQIVTALYVDTQKRVWLSTEDKGIWIIDKSTTGFIDKSELPGYLVPSIYQDKRGVIWICTFRGLVKLTNKFAAHFTPTTGLTEDDIRFSSKQADGSICMQTSLIKNGNLVSLPGNLARLISLSKIGTYVRGLQKDEKNRWWIFTTNNNLYRWQNNVLTKVTVQLNAAAIPGFFDANTNAIWFAQKNEVCIIQGDKVVKRTSTVTDGSSVNQIYSIKKDFFGHEWVSEKKRLLLMTENGLVDFTPNLQLQQNVYTEMACSNEKGIWFKTQGFGAIHFTFINNKWQKDKAINTDNGLPNNIVNDIETDSRQNIWIATLSGLYRFTENRNALNTYNTRRFTQADGIDVPNWNLAFLEKDSLQNIWLGVANGIFKINTAAIEETVSSPSVLIDKVTVLNDTNAQSTDTTRFSANDVHAVFNPGQNNIAFHFTGINLNNNFIRYAYRLVGIDRNWVSNQKNNEAIYYNLSPGKYSFIVKSVNDAGIESKTSSYHFTISPPFWQSFWFRLLVALLATALIYWFIRRRDAIKEKENLVVLKMSELKLAALQSQMNPHFIFNSLNSIQNYILQQKPIEAAKYLSKFSKLMRRILDHSLNNLTPLNDIVDTLKMYMELEAFRFSNEFSWEVIVTNAADISEVKLPSMLLQPYVENAIIHGLMPKQGDKKIVIRIFKNDNRLHCIIDDNGVGRANNSTKTDGHISHGQKLTEDMLITMKQLLHTDAQIKITDKTNEQNVPAGTMVDLIIPLNF